MGNRKRPVRASNHVAEMKASADAAGNQPTSQPSTQSNPELSNNFLIDRNSADASRRARQTKQPEGQLEPNSQGLVNGSNSFSATTASYSAPSAEGTQQSGNKAEEVQDKRVESSIDGQSITPLDAIKPPEAPEQLGATTQSKSIAADSLSTKCTAMVPAASLLSDSSAQKIVILQPAKAPKWHFAFYLGGLYNSANTKLNRDLTEEHNASTRQRVISTHQAIGGEIRGLATRRLLPILDLEIGIGLSALEQKAIVETFAGPKAKVQYSYGADSNSLLVRPVLDPVQATNSRLLFMPSGIVGFDLHRAQGTTVTSRSGLRLGMQITQVVSLAKKGDQHPATEGTVVCPQAALYRKLGNGLEVEGSWRMLILKTGGLPLATQSRSTNFLLGLGIRKTIR